MSADNDKLEFYSIYVFALMSIIGILFYAQSAWLLPVLLLLWGVIGLFRIVVLTTLFEGINGQGLSQKILRSLGLFRQAHRDTILSAVFLNSMMVMAGFLCVIVCTVIGLNPELPNTEFIFVTQSQQTLADIVQQNFHFFVMDALFFPLLVCIAFIVLLTYCTNARRAFLACGVLCGLNILICISMVGFGMGETGEASLSAFEHRVKIGGFALSALPYILGAYFVFLPLCFANFTTTQAWATGAYLFLLGASMAYVDLFLGQGSGVDAYMLSSWLQIAVLLGSLLYQWRADLMQYHALRKNLDFRTKAEHS